MNKCFCHLFNGLVRLQSDVRNIGIHHKGKKIQDQVGVPEKISERILQTDPISAVNTFNMH